MEILPPISIVTPYREQDSFLKETIESVTAEGYPDVEHLVLKENISISRTATLLSAFNSASGQIFGVLDPGDTLVPGALRRVARILGRGSQIHAVVGRCRVLDERGRDTGIERPNRLAATERLLQCWKGRPTFAPAAFWTAAVWRECGPAEADPLPDYSLFCRLARKHRFVFLDRLLANCRLQGATDPVWQREQMERAVRTSRAQWGSPLSLRYWRLMCSLARYRFDRTGRAYRMYAHACSRLSSGASVAGFFLGAGSGLLAPDVAFQLALYPRLRSVAGHLFSKISGPPRPQVPAQTADLLDHTGVWADGWAGPRTVFEIEAVAGTRCLVIRGSVDLVHLTPLNFRALIDGTDVGSRVVTRTGSFQIEFPLVSTLCPGRHVVEVRAGAWWIPHLTNGSGDYRPLSWRVQGTQTIRLTASDVSVGATGV